ncbi:Hypothetical protein, putative [Bodo saltans]|uniref:Uncharacterized protein n=1 Tax=Bodo saltans TaxID=75058 RepID=A0A0S4J6P6_BODSA|nr:Hypothetical protein, putative [Bodo saltans]|eukprot:CUG85697.1 Hypothetical protein, putative [Bodo saltans]
MAPKKRAREPFESDLTSHVQEEEVVIVAKTVGMEGELHKLQEELRKAHDKIRKADDVIRRLGGDGMFATVQAAFDSVSLRPKVNQTAALPFAYDLSVLKRCNDDATKEGVVSGVKALMAGFGLAVDKSSRPLMCVLGASGQGKTATLDFIRRDHEMQDAIRKQINAQFKPMDMECKHVVALFATFNQECNFISMKRTLLRRCATAFSRSTLAQISTQYRRIDSETLELKIL